MTAVMLAVVVMCGTLLGSYQEVQASSIVAGGAIVGTLEEILLSFGIFLLPSSMANSAQNSDWWYSEDGNAALKPYYDDLASEYEKERFKVINGGGGDPQPSPTPVPEQKPEIQPTPVPEVKPGEIPTFDELVAPALAGGAISWASGAWDTMAKAVGNLWDKFVNDNYTNNPLNDWKDEILYPNKQVDGYKRYAQSYYTTYDGKYVYYRQYYTSKNVQGMVLYSYTLRNETLMTSLLFDSDYKQINSYGSQLVYLDGAYYSSNDWSSVKIQDLPSSYKPSPISYTSTIPVYSRLDLSDADLNTPAKIKAIVEGSSVIGKSKENIWVHPDLQETYQNNGKLEYPQEAPQPLQYPSAENLADLAKKLNPEINPDYSPEIAPNYVQELIQKLQQDPSVNPDPNPNPNPNPDPGTDPQPTLKPNPTGTPENPTPEEEASPYKADLREIFPFCIPFDLIHLLKVFEADAEAPVFEFPLDIELDNPWTGEKVVDYHHTFKLDMSDYEPVVKILRIFQVVFFIIALMLITRQQMIKG